MNNDNDFIYKNDLPLHIDVYCYECKRLVALSNCVQMTGRNYCHGCAWPQDRGLAVLAFDADFNPSIIEID